MAPVRHRRRLTAARLIAVLAPLGTAALTAAAVVVGGATLVVAAVVGAAVSAVLGALLLRVEREGRVAVATVRAGQAAAYALEHELHAGEHRAFTTHLVGMLDLAEGRVATMRERLDGVEAEITATREALARRDEEAARAPSQELVPLGEGGGWEDLWPDLADAPTVVDLISWEERVRHDVPDEEPAERSA